MNHLDAKNAHRPPIQLLEDAPKQGSDYVETHAYWRKALIVELAIRGFFRDFTHNDAELIRMATLVLASQHTDSATLSYKFTNLDSELRPYLIKHFELQRPEDGKTETWALNVLHSLRAKLQNMQQVPKDIRITYIESKGVIIERLFYGPTENGTEGYYWKEVKA